MNLLFAINFDSSYALPIIVCLGILFSLIYFAYIGYFSIYIWNVLTFTTSFRKDYFRYSSKPIDPVLYRKIALGANQSYQALAIQNNLNVGKIAMPQAIKSIDQYFGINSKSTANDCLASFTTGALPMYSAAIRDNYYKPESEYQIDPFLSVYASNIKQDVESLHIVANKLIDAGIVSSEEEALKVGVSAWYSGRIAYLARACYTAKYFTEQEAIRWLDKAYDLSIAQFDSWVDFEKSYIVGRTVWARGGSFFEVYCGFARDLTTSKKSPWYNMNWK